MKDIQEFELDSDFVKLYEICPLVLKKQMDSIPDLILQQTDRELEGQFNLEEKTVLKRLRLSLWIEADRVFNSGQVVNFRLPSVYDSICDRKYFSKHVMYNNFKLTYICRRPVSYNVVTTEILSHGLDLKRQILDLDIIEDGKVNIKLLEIQLKIIESAENRIKGLPIARKHIRRENINPPAPTNLDSPYEEASVKDLKDELKKLEGQ